MSVTLAFSAACSAPVHASAALHSSFFGRREREYLANAERLGAVAKIESLDARPALDRIARLTAEVLGVPIASIALVGEHRHWHLAGVGIKSESASNEFSLCAKAVQSSDAFVVTDALADLQFSSNPGVVGPPFARFYAAAPLITAEGHRIGALCAMGPQPQAPTEQQLRQLTDLAALAMDSLGHRAATPAAELRSNGHAPNPLYDSREIEKELRESYLLLDSVVEGSGDAIFVKDRTGKIVFANHAATRLANLSPAQVIGHRDSDLVPPEVADRFRAQDLSVMESGEPQVYENRLIIAGEVRYQMTTLSPWRAADGALLGTFGVARDITALKHHEWALVKAKREADEANRAKSIFLANMSHELRTPLNAIIGFSQMLEQEVFGPVGSAKNAEYVHDIARSGQQLLELIDDILDLSRIEAGRTELDDEPITLNDAFEEQRMLHSGRAQDAGVTLTVVTPAEHFPDLRADRRALRTMLGNLLGNAVKFTPAGGTVRLEAALGAEGGISLAVADSGRGIAPEDMAHVRDVFHRGSAAFVREQSGSGLGLAIVDGLLRAHGAAMDIASEPGRGTTVRLDFPPARTLRQP